MDLQSAHIQTIDCDWLLHKDISLNVLRLDLLHPVVSGNKWFKLKYYLEEAKALGKTVVTFGGAWSNHIVATAYACSQLGLACIGVIRGEQLPVISDTLTNAGAYGMELCYVSRSDYALLKSGPKYWETMQLANYLQFLKSTDIYFIQEGGYGPLGAKGAADISRQYDLSAYTHIVAGVGTGTMLAGLFLGANSNQQVVGISSMKGNESLAQEVARLIGEDNASQKFTVLHDYHFGGFGKHPKAIIDFINDVYQQHHLPLDIVYTGKVFYAIKDLVAKGYFLEKSRVLMIHSGGLQGNMSVKDQLLF